MAWHVVLHVDAVPNRGSRPTYLLRESYREGARVRKRTLTNLSALSDAQIHAIRAVLGGEQLGPLAEADADRYRFARGPRDRPMQGRQALRAHHRGARLQLRAPGHRP